MAVAVARERGDAHSREDLPKTAAYRLAVPLDAAVRARRREKHRQAWVHRACAGGHEQREVVRIECLTRFHNQGHVPKTLRDHRLPHSRRGQQRRQRGARFAHVVVGEEDEPRTRASPKRGSSEVKEGRARARDTLCSFKRKIDGKNRTKRGGEFRHLPGCQNGRVQNGRIAHTNVKRHDVRFAQWIDGRIGDLREALFAVIPERPRQYRKKRRWRVVPHAPVSFLAHQQGRKQDSELIFGPAECRSRALRLDRNGRRGFPSLQAPPARSSALRSCAGKAAKNFRPAEDVARCGMYEQHFSRPEPLALGDMSLRNIQQPSFRTSD